MLLMSLALLVLEPAIPPQRPLDEGLQQLVSAISVEAGKRTRIAVVPFSELGGRKTVLGTFLAEELTTRLYQTHKYDIVERSLLDKVFREQRMGELGLIDGDSAKRLGKLIGAVAIISGTVTPFDSHVAINCRMIDTETGLVFGAANVKIFKDADLSKVLGVPLGEAGTSPGPAPDGPVEAGGGDFSKRFPINKKDGHVSPVLASVVPLIGSSRKAMVMGFAYYGEPATLFTHALRALREDGSGEVNVWLDDLSAIKNVSTEDFVVILKNGEERKLRWSGYECRERADTLYRCSYVALENPDGTREVLDLTKIRALEFR
jgi:TolB-like protein